MHSKTQKKKNWSMIPHRLVHIFKTIVTSITEVNKEERCYPVLPPPLASLPFLPPPLSVVASFLLLFNSFVECLVGFALRGT